MKKKLIALGIITSMLVSISGCGNRNKTQNTKENLIPITMVLDWTPNTNHTGLYVAEKKGYFKAAGLDVSIVQPPDGGATDLVASGGAEFGIDFQDTLAAAFASSSPLPITAIAAILQHNTSGLISLKEKEITSPAKLEGHSYATWDSPIEQAILESVVKDDNGDFEQVQLISTYVDDIVAALKADIDSVWIYYGWDGIKCEMEGMETNYLSFRQLDEAFDYYSPVIIGNNDYLEENPDTVKAFVSAVKKGYEFASQNPEASADILLDAVPELDKDLVEKSQTYLSGEYISDGEEWGFIDENRWNAFYNWLNKNELVENNIPEGTGFSNDYLSK